MVLTKTDQVKKEIESYLTKQFLFEFDDQNITAETDLFTSGVIDSFGCVELVSFLEKKYKIKVTDDELLSDSIRSVHALVDFIEGKVNEKG